jgi:flagellar biosynthesis protein FlhG
VVIPELTSISDCYGLYKHLRQAQAEIECRLLINRAQDAAEAQYLHQKFGAVTERFLGKAPRCVGFVLEDGSVRKSVAAQTPLAAAAENSVVVQTLTRIALILARELSPEAVTERAAILETANNVTPAAADIRE